MTNDDEGEGGVKIPPKIDDVIYEQPLTAMAHPPLTEATPSAEGVASVHGVQRPISPQV